MLRRRVTLSAEQIALFRERGWFSLGRPFGARELAELGAAYDAALAKPMRIGEPGQVEVRVRPAAPATQSRCCGASRPPRRCVRRCSSPCSGPDVRLYWGSGRVEAAGHDSETPWHQDNGYGAVVPAEYVTLTLALDPMTVANGCLWIQPGSHRAGPQPHRDTGGFFQIGYDGPETGEPLEARAPARWAVFSSLTLHRAGANPTASRALRPG